MQMVTNSNSNSDEPGRLHGHWLIVARISWIMCVALTLVIFFASLPEYSAQLQTPCAGTSCWYTQLSAGQIEALKGIGLSPGVYTVYTVALTIASVVLCLVVSLLIVWRRADDRMAVLVAIMLVAFGPIYATSSLVAVPSPWQVPNECLYFLALILLVLVFLLFPSGQFVPRWTRWAFLVLLALQIPLTLLPVAPLLPNNPASQFGWFVTVGEFVLIAAVQFYRFRRVSSPPERQQTKWVIFGLAVPITIHVIATALDLFFPTLAERSVLYLFVFN